MILDHVAIAVPSLAAAAPVWERVAGGRASEPELLEDQGVRVCFVGSGAGRLELIEPVDEEGGVARFLRKRGPGLHHVAFRVPDLAAALEALAAEGVEPIDRAPRRGAGGHLVAFLHPRAAGGILVELVEG